MSIDMVQKLVVEIDSVKILERYLILALKTVFSSYKEVAIMWVKHTEDNTSYLPPFLREKNQLPVILIHDYHTSSEKEKTNFVERGGVILSNLHLTDLINWVRLIIGHHRENWEELFIEKTDEEYDAECEECDDDFISHPSADAIIGFRLESRFPSSADVIAISLCYIPFGK
ncbi:MAG: hypothetical protein U9P90_04245 [Patescibacteria group bacterium]|nr:hypothetical protein [Patescibacteria group bacterium]